MIIDRQYLINIIKAMPKEIDFYVEFTKEEVNGKEYNLLRLESLVRNKDKTK